MYDLVRLERLAIPSVAIATEPFADEAVEQARRCGMPDCRVVYVPHPVQLLTTAELRGLAEAAFPGVVAALTDAGTGRRR